jgi:GPI mannosyltransferase 3
MISIIKSPHKYVFIISLIIYFTTAFYSVGYYHADEQFQILEFSNYKLGNSPATDLPWEFRTQIRPALQPSIAMVFVTVLSKFGITNAFTYSLVLRLFCSFFTWLLICKLCLLLIKDFSTSSGKLIFTFLSLLIGFMPFISARFSSENLAALMFLWALYFIIKNRCQLNNSISYQSIFLGLLLAFSFFFRFSMAFAILGLVLWLIIINKISCRNLILMAVSAFAAVIFCILIDYWFYGKFVITPYHYYKANIDENVMAYFGVSPWWFFIAEFINVYFPVVIVLILLFFVIGIFKRFSNVFVWCVIPFLIAHFLLGHKEMRFLFPIAFVFIYLLSSGLDYIINVLKINKYGKYLFIIIIVLNIPALFSKMFIPANNDLYFYKYLYDKNPKSEIDLIGDVWAFGYGGHKVNFYNNSNINCIHYKNDEDFINILNTNKHDTIYVKEWLLTEKKYPGYKSECVCRIYPNWLIHLDIFGWIINADKNNLQMLTK